MYMAWYTSTDLDNICATAVTMATFVLASSMLFSKIKKKYMRQASYLKDSTDFGHRFVKP